MENGFGMALADELRDDWSEFGMPKTRAEAELDIVRKCIEPLKWDTYELYEAYAECHDDPVETADAGDGTPKERLIDGMHLGYYVVDWLVETTTNELATELEGI